jgi:PAS domain S-box-containing protein
MLLSEQYTEHIINSLPGIFYILDEEGRFILWNKNLEVVTGYSTEELKKANALDFFEGADRDYIASQIQRTFEEGQTSSEAILVNKYKIRTPYYLTGIIIQFEGRACMIGMGLDISKRRTIEEHLKESEERYRIIVETAREGIWLLDEHHKTSFVNERMAQILGYEREEMLGKTPYEFTDEDKWKEIDIKFEKSKQGESEQYEFTLRKKDGEPVCLLIHSNPFMRDGVYKGGLAMITDITARKEIERKLMESERKFRSLVQNSSDIITVHDENRCYTYVSPAITGTLGYKPDFFLGKDVIDFIWEADHQIVLNGFNDLLTKGVTDNVLYRVFHQNGECRWLESRGRNMLDDPTICGLVINTRDVTDRVLLQQALDEQNKKNQKEITIAVIKTQESERSQIGQELHDNVNQVLTTIKLYNEMLRDGLGDPKELIPKSVQLLQGCIDEIRNISRLLSAPTIGRISLIDSIKELVDSINHTKKIEVNFSMTNPEHLPISQELHLAIYRIVQEKLNNIIKYADASIVSIKIEIKEKILHLIIRDNGKGFDLNNSLDGIGITNMRTRAENLNGTFEIVSEPSKGCVVEVRIPVTPGP